MMVLLKIVVILGCSWEEVSLGSLNSTILIAFFPVVLNYSLIENQNLPWSTRNYDQWQKRKQNYFVPYSIYKAWPKEKYWLQYTDFKHDLGGGMIFRFKLWANHKNRCLCCPWRGGALTGTGNAPLAKSLPVTFTSKTQDILLEATIPFRRWNILS